VCADETSDKQRLMSQTRVLRQGEVFAHEEMLIKSTHGRTTRAREHVQLLALTNDDFIDVLHQFPDIYQRVYQHALNNYNYSI